MNSAHYKFNIATAFLWLGFIAAISFMEAWLKFRAPGVTIPIGMSIGKLVFSALNRMESLFALGITFNFLITRPKRFSRISSIFIFILLILLIQTFWLLPILDLRADARINNQEIPPSFHHLYYIILEMIKTIALTIFGILNLKQVK
ncbi:MAG TPA: hypothetical protein PK006_13025 [Saprospiraceae bacterium]|nr:hypothetical protein [Saprospiraceae bacterium]